jgi:hypothetical protein
MGPRRPDAWELRVWDSGPGMKESGAPRDDTGKGLGLPLVRRLCDDLGARWRSATARKEALKRVCCATGRRKQSNANGNAESCGDPRYPLWELLP